MGSPTSVILQLKPVDRKDFEVPAKYSGNPDEWLSWSNTFKKFLRRREPRWFALQETTEEQRGKPVTATILLKLVATQRRWTRGARYPTKGAPSALRMRMRC